MTWILTISECVIQEFYLGACIGCMFGVFFGICISAFMNGAKDETSN